MDNAELNDSKPNALYFVINQIKRTDIIDIQQKIMFLILITVSVHYTNRVKILKKFLDA